MAIIENPVLAMPVRPEGRLSFRQFLRLVRENTLGTYPPEAFDDEIIAGRLLWRRRFIINEPSGIRHVLLDNAANYRKSELTRRLLEPGLGRGLLTSEGETWRRHRRIMAPAFDRLSMESYAPIITGVTSELLARLDVLPNLSEVDVGAAMMHTTLHIISRTMFSANSDEIVEVVERGVGQYSTCWDSQHGSRSFFLLGEAPLFSTNSTKRSISSSITARVYQTANQKIFWRDW